MAEVTVWGKDFSKKISTQEENATTNDKEREEIRLMLLQSVLVEIDCRKKPPS